MTLPVILSILAAVIATAPLAVARWRQRRPASGPELDQVDRDALPESSSDEPDVSAYRGLALASAVRPAAGDDDTGRTGDLVEDPPPSEALGVQGGRGSPPELPNGARVIGYATASADAARDHEAFAQIEALCEQAGWEVLEIILDQDISRMPDRPGLSRALEQIAAGDARGLVIADTGRLIDSLGDLAALLDWFRHAGAPVVAVDLDLDTSTSRGHQTASTLMTVAGWESERRRTRTRRDLVEVAKPGSEGSDAAEAGAALSERIGAMGAAGRSPQAVADELDHDVAPRLQGRIWLPFDVERALANARVPGRLRYALRSLRREERR